MFDSIINWFKKLVQTVETAEFSTIYGSTVRLKWFTTLMQDAGRYLFCSALLIFLVKLGLAIRHYYYAKNKNLEESSNLAWIVFQTAIIATAIIGTLLAATTFFVVTPVLFACAMVLDSLRSTALLVWNISQLTRLYFTNINNQANPLAKLKYKHYQNKYLANIKDHFIGAAVGAIVTTAVIVIMVLPHVGLGAVAAAGITIAGVKLSMMAVTGVCAAVTLAAPIAIPLGIKCLKKIDSVCEYVFNKTLSLLTSPFSSKPKVQVKGKQPVVPQHKVVKQETNPLISNDDQLRNAEKPLSFNAYSYHSNFRDEIVKHIDQNKPEIAFTYTKIMINEKIATLKSQVKDTLSWSGWWQHNKRQQKLSALQSIQSHIIEMEKAAKRGLYLCDLDRCIAEVEKKYPNIDKSFFLQESDTRNIINALKAYTHRFHSSSPSKSDKIPTAPLGIYPDYLSSSRSRI